MLSLFLLVVKVGLLAVHEGLQVNGLDLRTLTLLFLRLYFCLGLLFGDGAASRRSVLAEGRLGMDPLARVELVSEAFIHSGLEASDFWCGGLGYAVRLLVGARDI